MERKSIIAEQLSMARQRQRSLLNPKRPDLRGVQSVVSATVAGTATASASTMVNGSRGRERERERPLPATPVSAASVATTMTESRRHRHHHHHHRSKSRSASDAGDVSEPAPANDEPTPYRERSRSEHRHHRHGNRSRSPASAGQRSHRSQHSHKSNSQPVLPPTPPPPPSPPVPPPSSEPEDADDVDVDDVEEPNGGRTLNGFTRSFHDPAATAAIAAQLEALQESSRAQFTAMRESHKREMAKMKELLIERAKAVLQSKHEQMEQFKANCEKEMQDKLTELQEAHNKQIEELIARHQERESELKADIETARADLESARAQHVKDRKEWADEKMRITEEAEKGYLSLFSDIASNTAAAVKRVQNEVHSVLDHTMQETQAARDETLRLAAQTAEERAKLDEIVAKQCETVISEYRRASLDAQARAKHAKQQAELEIIRRTEEMTRRQQEFESTTMAQAQALIDTANKRADEATAQLAAERHRFALLEVEVRRQFELHCHEFERMMRSKAAQALTTWRRRLAANPRDAFGIGDEESDDMQEPAPMLQDRMESSAHKRVSFASRVQQWDTPDNSRTSAVGNGWLDGASDPFDDDFAGDASGSYFESSDLPRITGTQSAAPPAASYANSLPAPLPPATMYSSTPVMESMESPEARTPRRATTPLLGGADADLEHSARAVDLAVRDLKSFVSELKADVDRVQQQQQQQVQTAALLASMASAANAHVHAHAAAPMPAPVAPAPAAMFSTAAAAPVAVPVAPAFMTSMQSTPARTADANLLSQFKEAYTRVKHSAAHRAGAPVTSNSSPGSLSDDLSFSGVNIEPVSPAVTMQQPSSLKPSNPWHMLHVPAAAANAAGASANQPGGSDESYDAVLAFMSQREQAVWKLLAAADNS